jgi:hypothetical protein
VGEPWKLALQTPAQTSWWRRLRTPRPRALQEPAHRLDGIEPDSSRQGHELDYINAQPVIAFNAGNP